MLEIQLNNISTHIQIVVYVIAAFMVLRRAKKIYLENYTGANIESLNWLFQFTLALSAFYSMDPQSSQKQKRPLHNT